MNFQITALALTCAVALAACGNDPQPPAQDTTPAPAAPAASAPPAEAPAAPATVTAAPAADGKPAAVVSNCATSIEGNEAKQFNVGSLIVPASFS